MTSIPEGELSSALIANPQADGLFEVFCHPFTAGELITQSKLRALKVNGKLADAEVVDRLGNGDYVVRIRIRND